MNRILPDYYESVIALTERVDVSKIQIDKLEPKIIYQVTLGEIVSGYAIGLPGRLSGIASLTLLATACAASSGGIQIGEGVKFQNEIRAAFNAYVSAYGCQPVVTAVVGTQIEGNVQQDTTVEEQVKGHEISYFTQDNPEKTRNITKHALTHACKIDGSEKKFDDPFELEPGVKVLGVNGFFLEVQLSDGSTSYFTKIEEGVAEALASKMGPGYTVDSESYFNVGSLTIKFMNLANLTPKQLAEMQQSSDLKGFIAAVFKKSPDEITSGDYIRMASYYNEAYAGTMTAEDIFNDMIANP